MGSIGSLAVHDSGFLTAGENRFSPATSVSTRDGQPTVGGDAGDVHEPTPPWAQAGARAGRWLTAPRAGAAGSCPGRAAAVGFVAGIATDDVHPDNLMGSLYQPFVSVAVGVILFEAGLRLSIEEVDLGVRKAVVRLVAGRLAHHLASCRGDHDAALQRHSPRRGTSGRGDPRRVGSDRCAATAVLHPSQTRRPFPAEVGGHARGSNRRTARRSGVRSSELGRRLAARRHVDRPRRWRGGGRCRRSNVVAPAACTPAQRAANGRTGHLDGRRGRGGCRRPDPRGHGARGGRPHGDCCGQSTEY